MYSTLAYFTREYVGFGSGMERITAMLGHSWVSRFPKLHSTAERSARLEVRASYTSRQSQTASLTPLSSLAVLHINTTRLP